uniref:Cadherin domain-containing protein n=1 Tax=Sinocyclocheilus grahami TaxID=75366 RepID=A0A672SAU8_SINGR
MALCFSFLLCFGPQVSAQIRYTVPEEIKEGSVVGNIAKDLGLDVSTLVDRRFRIVSGSKDAFFQVNQNNGELYIHKSIDREELCDGNGACVVNLKTAVENPLEIHYVAVEVTDINDNHPSFSEQNQHFEIAEHTPLGTSFQLHAARDQDASPYSVRLYKLSQDENFEIYIRNSDEEKIPFLVLKKPLDREHKSEHLLILKALDGGNPPKSGTLNITVTVLDSNDNRPVFSQDTYSVSLQENSPIGTTVIKINASDSDEGPNSEIEYALGKTLKRKVYDIFQLDRITGEIKVKGAIDFEDTDVYKLDVQASDKGQPPLSAQGRVIINIQDINDNMPEIELTSLSNIVAEDCKPGTVIALINNMYSLVTKGRLDRELVPHYDITITATDLGQPTPCLINLKFALENPLEIHYVIVEILDVNDHAPSFPESQMDLEIGESALPGARFQLQAARDSDSGSNSVHQYKLGHNDNFRLEVKDRGEDGKIPVLILQKHLDRELTRTINLHITALDGGKPAKSGTMDITINVIDINDNVPVFTKDIYSVMLNENAPIGTPVIQVNATDCDEGSNGEVVYSFGKNVNSKVRKLFDINTITGEITVEGLLDYEDKDSYEIDIQASDKGTVPHRTDKKILIDVLDINDNVPIFTKESYTVVLNENAPVGTTIVQVNATDMDDGQNGQVVYALGNNVNNNLRELFQVNPVTGEIIVTGVLDFEVKDLYEIDIQASDKGIVPLATDKSVIIKIVDVNDNAPEIEVTSFSNAIPEDSRPGTTVALISVTDLDSGLNGKISCSISDDIPFKLMPSSHDNIYSLVTSGLLDRETKFQYDITLVAKDAGQQTLSTIKTITALISDVNDNIPEFSFSPYAFYVMENNVPGKFVFSVSATDKDSNENSFDFEIVKTFQFHVVAADSGTPQWRKILNICKIGVLCSAVFSLPGLSVPVHLYGEVVFTWSVYGQDLI